MGNNRKIVAWLVTWEWTGDHAKVENKIAAILNYRLLGENVRRIVELLYANNQYTLSERIAYAKNKKTNPYPARFDVINRKPWAGRIYCGHNPHLYARLVDDLVIKIDENGDEIPTWKERAIPKLRRKQET